MHTSNSATRSKAIRSMASSNCARTALTKTWTGMRAARNHRPVHAAIKSHDPGTRSAPARTSVCRVARMRDSDTRRLNRFVVEEFTA
jgi:hypothetical protein